MSLNYEYFVHKNMNILPFLHYVFEIQGLLDLLHISN